MRIVDWFFGKRYLEWDEYVQKMEEKENTYWEWQSKKSRLNVSK